MNTIELRAVEILKDLKENHAAIAVKAEFEAEGTRLEELLRLKEVCMQADMELILKIGGCESVRDMLEAQIIGVDYLVAPMVESPYALQKYLQAVNTVFPSKEKEHVAFLCNIETITAMNTIDAMLSIPEINLLKGIVIERIDLCFSLGLPESAIDEDQIKQYVLSAMAKAKEKNLMCTIGGGVSANSLSFFKSLPQDYLDRYETRKVTFNGRYLLSSEPEKGILKALGFELMWLKNKINFYKGISAIDEQRISHIEKRYWKEIDALL